MFFQVAPPSVDLYTPSPYETELRGFASPVPAHTTFVSVGSTAIAPSETVSCLSNWCVTVVPWLTVLRIPPDAVAMNHSDGSLSWIAISVMRPAILAGPMDRHLTLFISSGSTFMAGGNTGALAAGLSAGFTAVAAGLVSAGFASAGLVSAGLVSAGFCGLVLSSGFLAMARLR